MFYFLVRLVWGLDLLTYFPGVSGDLYQVNWKLNFASASIYITIVHHSGLPVCTSVLSFPG